MLKPVFFVLFLFLFTALHAQTDSLPVAGTGTITAKAAMPVAVPGWHQDTAFTRFFVNRLANNRQQPVFAINAVRQPVHEDEQFYILAGLLLLAGITRAAYPKYFTNLFRMFFESSYRQKQSKESIVQDTLPSLLLNIVFILSGGLLLTAFAKGNSLFQHLPFVLLWIYACGILTIIYTAKSFFIIFCGWSFNVQQPAADYRFIVFLINKVAGLCFIPLLLLLTYATGTTFSTLITISVTFIFILLIYRYVVSLSVAGKNLKINPMHFFLYLCAVEILPMLVIYKLLFVTAGNQFSN